MFIHKQVVEDKDFLLEEILISYSFTKCSLHEILSSNDVLNLRATIINNHFKFITHFKDPNYFLFRLCWVNLFIKFCLIIHFIIEIKNYNRY